MHETILSAGIDIGTTTTQLIFSRLTIQTVSDFGRAPRVEVVDKEIIYRSAIYFTPLRSHDEINGELVADIIRNEYAAAGLKPEDISTGAVIVTGESARKRNAAVVAAALSELAGDFVVAAAGPDLESLLAGRGAMADVVSKETGIPTINLDIGGGTTNLCLFEDGQAVATGCYDIGGRLIRLNENKIAYISPKLSLLLQSLNMSLTVGDVLSASEGLKIASAMADILAESVGLKPPTPLGNACITNHALAFSCKPQQLTFSGGVADCIYNNILGPFTYGDLGVLLGQAIRVHPLFSAITVVKTQETMRATVIGAGNYSMQVSGSTISYDNCRFPMKNLPVLRLECDTAVAISELPARLRDGLAWLRESDVDTVNFAIALDGPACPGFVFVEQLAQCLTEFIHNNGFDQHAVPIVLEHDFGKALGQALRRRLGHDVPILCIDGIACRNGDYIDIGAPLSQGRVVPVIVKTLIFS